MSNQQRAYWEARAATYRNMQRGVLFQGLPPALNAAIHQWHEQIVTRYFSRQLPSQANVLDLAAGYGRLSTILKAQRPDLWLCGADMSLIYSTFYVQAIGPALCADLAHPPYGAACWDGILLVTGLMYLDDVMIDEALTQVLLTLKPGGILLCLDPGQELIRGLRWLGVGRQASMSMGFTRERYLALFNRPDCTVVAKGSNGWFTLLLPLLWLLAASSERYSVLFLVLLNSVNWLDQRAGCFAQLALHRWVMVQKIA